MAGKMGLWEILSGEAYTVRANSEDEALELYFKYNDGSLTEEEKAKHEFEYLETATEATPIREL